MNPANSDTPNAPALDTKGLVVATLLARLVQATARIEQSPQAQAYAAA